MSSSTLFIDGTHGGGQILRSSLTLSAITQKPFQIQNIRQARPQSGLKAQHLTCVHAMANLCRAEVSGNKENSTEVCFTPRQLPSGEHGFSIGTAGATSLLLQTIFYAMAHHPSGGLVRLFGGTHGSHAPTYDYLEQVWQPLMAQLHGKLKLDCRAYGLYPKGGGQLEVAIPGAQHFQAIQWKERPSLDQIRLQVLVGSPNKVQSLKTLEDTTVKVEAGVGSLLRQMGYDFTTQSIPVQSFSSGIVVSLVCQFGVLRAGFTAWESKKTTLEQLGAQVASEALRYLTSPAVLDEHSADQLLLPLSLASGDSVFTAMGVTEHMQSHAQVIEIFLPSRKIQFKELSDGCVEVHVRNAL